MSDGEKRARYWTALLGGMPRSVCLGCGRPSLVHRLMCLDCHESAERREPGPWALARKAERERKAREGS